MSILKEHDYGFEFPKEMGCEITLKDVLEEEVEEKYYINTDRAKELIQKLCNTNQITSGVTPCDSTIMNPKALTIGNCITARYDAGIQNKQSIGIAICETVPPKFLQEKPEYRIRKLTPKECWRLMGCSDADFHKAEQVNSNTQLYKQAGNSIVVNVLEEIFRNMLKNE